MFLHSFISVLLKKGVPVYQSTSGKITSVYEPNIMVSTSKKPKMELAKMDWTTLPERRKIVFSWLEYILIYRKRLDR